MLIALPLCFAVAFLIKATWFFTGLATIGFAAIRIISTLAIRSRTVDRTRIVMALSAAVIVITCGGIRSLRFEVIAMDLEGTRRGFSAAMTIR